MANQREKDFKIKSQPTPTFEDKFVKSFEARFPAELNSFPGFIADLAKIMMSDFARQAIDMELSPPMHARNHFTDLHYTCECYLEFMVDCYELYEQIKE